MKTYLLGICLLLISSFTYGQSTVDSVQNPASVAADVPALIPLNQVNSPEHKTDAPDHMSEQSILALCILGFGLLAIIGEIFFIQSMGDALKMDAFDALRLLTVTLIIVGALFVSMGTNDNTRTAAATGLLGTIAGYMLARSGLTKGGPTDEVKR
ncbi:hypothetical protein [Spirosoma endbachense]|uniref:Uncharacterized protein n=1 Tax=Spirosoma endbachense TaxID=2666025 RepID=A0A6P1VQP4_9BACT|nr:hypothetical protein [Spirosoma endbachense]QHV94934.1 hypothetical protein GJR95_07835 [Spirosoma endbachense]